MPSFDPPGTVSKLKHIICGVHLDVQDVGNGRNLIHSEVNDRFPSNGSRTGTDMVDLTVAEHPLSISMRLRRSQ